MSDLLIVLGVGSSLRWVMGQRSVITLLSQLVMAVDESLLSSIITVRPPYPTHMIVHSSYRDCNLH